MVKEASCEISMNSGFSQGENSGQLSTHNNSSRQLSSPNTSSRNISSPENSQRKLCDSNNQANEEGRGEQTDTIDEDKSHKGLEDPPSEELKAFQGPRSIYAAKRSGGSIASSINSCSGSHLGDFGGDYRDDDESLSDSSEDHDYGGPRWSKPELNEELNISVHSHDDHRFSRNRRASSASSSRRSIQSVDDPRVNATGRHRRSSASSFSRPRLTRARDFKPMPVIRSTSIDLPQSKVPNKDSKPAANAPVISSVIEEDEETSERPPVLPEEYPQQSSFRAM